MRQLLLPRSAAPSEGDDERSLPVLNVDLKFPRWLKATLRELYPGQGTGKRSCWTDGDYFTRFTNLLSSKTAIWTLCSFSPESVLTEKHHRSMEAVKSREVKAFIVSVDTKTDNRVIFKLTYDTIQSLIDFHRDHFSVNMGPSAQNLLNNFTKIADRFVYLANATVLKNLNLEAGGMLSAEDARIVEKEIIGLFKHIPLGGIDPSVVLTQCHTEEQCVSVASSGPAATAFNYPNFNYGAYSHSQDAGQHNFPMQNAHPVYDSYLGLPYPYFIAESPNILSPGDDYGSSFWNFGG